MVALALTVRNWPDSILQLYLTVCVVLQCVYLKVRPLRLRNRAVLIETGYNEQLCVDCSAVHYKTESRERERGGNNSWINTFPFFLIPLRKTSVCLGLLFLFPVGCCTLRKKRVPKGFFGCPHRRTLFGCRSNPFGCHLEPSVESVLHGTTKRFTWNQKGFFKGLSYGDSWRTHLGSRWHLFF